MTLTAWTPVGDTRYPRTSDRVPPFRPLRQLQAGNDVIISSIGVHRQWQKAKSTPIIVKKPTGTPIPRAIWSLLLNPPPPPPPPPPPDPPSGVGVDEDEEEVVEVSLLVVDVLRVVGSGDLVVGSGDLVVVVVVPP